MIYISQPAARTCGHEQQHDEEDGREELARELHIAPADSFLLLPSSALVSAATEGIQLKLNRTRVPFPAFIYKT